MVNDPILVHEFELEMTFNSQKDYGGRLSLEGVNKNSGILRRLLCASSQDKNLKNSGFGKRIVYEFDDERFEFLEKTPTGILQIDGELFKRINLDKYLISFCYKSNVRLINWNLAIPQNSPVVSKIIIADFNPKELIAVLAVAIKENASMLGTRYASFDIPALEKVPEINEFMKKHLTRAI